MHENCHVLSDLLFNSKDKDAAYIAMVDILKMAPYESETSGLQVSKYVEENFNREIVVQKYKEIVENAK